MVSYSKEDPRLFGAMAVVQKDGFVLVVQDEAKKEKSALVNPNDWWYTDRPVVNFPGGGRAQNQFGKQETVLQNLKREFAEEVPGKIVLPYRNRNTGHLIKQQSYPFAAAQLKETEVHQIGVTTQLYPFESFSHQSKIEIERLVSEHFAQWVSLKQLYEALRDGSPESVNFEGKKSRPQLFATASIWYLEQDGRDLKEIEWIVANANRELITQVKIDSQKKRIPIKNGSFQDSGRVSTTLNKRDRTFILGK
jgi:hypothetical protein